MRSRLFGVVAGAVFAGGRSRNAGDGAPLVRGGIRREEAGEAAGHRHEDGVDQPARVDPHRRQEAGWQDRELDGRRRDAERAAAPRLQQEVAAARHRDLVEGYQAKDGAMRANGRDITSRTAASCSWDRRAPALRMNVLKSSLIPLDPSSFGLTPLSAQGSAASPPVLGFFNVLWPILPILLRSKPYPPPAGASPRR